MKITGQRVLVRQPTTGTGSPRYLACY